MREPKSKAVERHRTFPKSIQPGIPKLGKLKPGWKRVKIGSLFEIINRPCKLTDAESYRLVTVKRSRGGLQSRGDLLGADIAVKSQFYIENEDFLISKRQIVHGACAIVSEKFAGYIVSNEYAVLRCTSALHIEFLRQLIHSVHFQQTCFHSSLGVHVEKMIFSTPEWFKWQIDIPEIHEQQKIADFLGAVDERIKLLQHRRDAMHRYKQGIMQRIFSQSICFKRDDGSAFPDWKPIRLGDVVEVFSGGTPTSTNSSYFGGTIPFIRSGEIDAHRTEQFLTTIGLQQSSAKIVKAGDLLFALYGANSGETGISKIDGAINQAVLCIRSNQEIGFLYQFLRMEKNRITSTYLQGGQGNLSGQIVKEIKLPLPDIDEQKKIVAFLTAIDEKTSAFSAKVKQMQTFKKGLLQQMFV